MLRFLIFTTIFCLPFIGNAQIEVDYAKPKKYTISAIEVESDRVVNKRIVASLSGLTVGDEVLVPGDELSKVITKLWEQKLFSDVEVKVEETGADQIKVIIRVMLRPRLSSYSIEGLSKSQQKNVREKLSLTKGDVVTEQYVHSIKNKIENYYVEKGFANPKIEVIRTQDTMYNGNSDKMRIVVDRGSKTKISAVNIDGNAAYSDFKVRTLLKKTKQNTWQYVFRGSKFIDKEYQNDKDNIIAFYNKKGYRDAKIITDSVYKTADDRIAILIRVDEGNLYYFKDISFSGNTKYSTVQLERVLGIQKGDIYNPAKLETNLRMNPAGYDISSLYMDDGYLFFNVVPVEKSIRNDSIDLEIRIFEGPQATNNAVTARGNERTNDHVILRELRSRPGRKFSRSDIFNTQRELSNLGYFDPEQLDLTTNPNPNNGTVDIEYVVVERPNDQIELSMGWGNQQLVGILGLSLNNFSTRNMFKKWNAPYPMGDGQKLSIRAQSSGRIFQSYNFSFTEPWFGGKRPTSLSFGVNHSIFSNNREKDDPDKYYLKVSGASIGVGKRLQWPGYNFSLAHNLQYQRYQVDNYPSILPFTNGVSNSINLTHTLSRQTLDQFIYPKQGSKFSLSLQWTPPLSYFRDVNFKQATDQEKYKWLEYHKWRFDSEFYVPLTRNKHALVMMARVNFGLLGSYNSDYGSSPFERFYVGGDGLTGFRIDGRELIRLRGYNNNAITPSINGNQVGGTIFNKYTFELRYPLSLNQQATAYVLGFVEGGNNYLNFRDYSPFDLYRSAGLGFRIFLPMFGLLGFDYGWGFDGPAGTTGVRPDGGKFHISIGQQF
ncbi:MAG: outer membrane protein assembly factor BamA [Bacteroidetes bacterium]|nr:outer membrane protein assembly factor BamA [Bacteroidota bacterium]